MAEPLDITLQDMKHMHRALRFLLVFQIFNCYTFALSALSPSATKVNQFLFSITLLQALFLLFEIVAVWLFISWKSTPSMAIYVVICFWMISISFILNITVWIACDSYLITNSLTKFYYSIYVAGGAIMTWWCFSTALYMQILYQKLVQMQREQANASASLQQPTAGTLVDETSQCDQFNPIL